MRVIKVPRRPARELLLLVVCGLLAAGASGAAAANRIRLVASINDLGSIAATVGGDQVEVTGICRPTADPHRVEVLPSYMVRVSRAKLYLKVGLGLDQWAEQVIDGSHNSGLVIVDCSRGVPVLEKPTGKVDASMGDVHPDGNPHYWLDPANGAIVARTIAEALARVDPAHAADYAARADRFGEAARAAAARGKETVAALPGRGIITYHRSWTYLANAFGLDVLGTIEPVPGIPPTARHLAEVVQIIRQQKPVIILQEPYFSRDAGDFLARETGIRTASLSASCDDTTPGSYLARFDSLLALLQGGAPAPAAGGAR
jgi:zinc/manganese transport system substrate-binding protein